MKKIFSNFNQQFMSLDFISSSTLGRRLLLFFVAMMLFPVIALGDNGYNGYHYTKANARVQATGTGAVYVSYGEAQDVTYSEKSSAEHRDPESGNKDFNGSVNYTYYFYAQAAVGYTLEKWVDEDNAVQSTALNFSKPIPGTKDNVNKDKIITYTAVFKPIITIPQQNKSVTLSKQGDTEAQEQIEISLYNASYLNISIQRTAGTGTADITCANSTVTGTGAETVTLTIATTAGVVHGDKFTITLTATNGAVAEIYVDVLSEIQVLFARPDAGQGSYTATRSDGSGVAYTLSHDGIEDIPVTMTNISQYTYSVVASPAEGYRFRRWTIQNALGTSYSYDATYTYTAKNGERFSAEFVKDTYAQFIVLGSDTAKYKYSYLDDAIAEAQRLGLSVVAVYKQGTAKDVNGVILPKPENGTYTIPKGITLLVPGTADYKYRLGYLTSTDYVNTSTSSCWRKLIVEEGTTINVFGNLCVFSPISAKQNYNGQPYTYGQIHLSNGSHIIAEEGSKICAYGYITGDHSQSSVVIKDGAEAYEIFQFTDWRGGSAMLLEGLANNSKEVLPIAQYYIQNIETLLRVQNGGKLYLTTGVIMQESNLPISAILINEATTGEDQGLFCLGSGSEFQKYYDGETDRVKMKVVGVADNAIAKFSYILITITGSYNMSFINVPVNTTVDSRNFVLPVNNNMDIEVDNLELTLPYRVAFMAGSSLKINDNAQFKIQNKVYFYDKELNVQPADVNKGYYSASDSPLLPLHYTAYHGKAPGKRTAEKSRYPEKLEDAKLIVNGAMTMEGNGLLYTTIYTTDVTGVTDTSVEALARDFGANITSDGGGTINYNAVGSASVTYQIAQAGEVTYPEIPVHNARLRNADGTFSGGENALQGETYTYFKNEGKWLKPDAGIPTWSNNEFNLTLPQDISQDVVCDVVASGVTISSWDISISGNGFALNGEHKYDATAQKLTIPVKYSHQNKHNVGTPNKGALSITIHFVDPIAGNQEKTVTIPLTAIEDYTPDFTVTINGTSLVDGDTYADIVGSGVNETISLPVVITSAANNVASAHATWIEPNNATTAPFGFLYGTTDESKLSAAQLTYTPTMAGEHTGTLTLEASYTDANGLRLAKTVTINLGAKVNLKQNTLAFAKFPDKIYSDDSVTPAFSLFAEGSKNSDANISITLSESGIVEISDSEPYVVNPLSAGTVTIIVTQEASASIAAKTLETTLTVLSIDGLVKMVPMCIEDINDFNIHTIGASAVSYNTSTSTIDFNSTTSQSEWIFQFHGVPSQLTFIPIGNNTWNIQERASETAAWTNIDGAVWTKLVSNQPVSFSLLPTTRQIRIQYGVATAEVGTITELCISAMTVQADVDKLYMPIYHKTGEVSEKTIKLLHTQSVAPAINLNGGLAYEIVSTSDNLGTTEEPYYQTLVSVKADATIEEGSYEFAASFDEAESIVSIRAYKFPQELPIKLATDDAERYNFVTTASAYAEWDATNHQVIFQNPGAQLTRSVTFAFNGAPSIIKFDASVDINDALWTIEESVDGTPGSFFAASLAKRDSVDGTTLTQELNYTTRYVRVSYNSEETYEVILSNLVIEGYPKAIVSPESMLFSPKLTFSKLTLTAINLKEVNFVLDNNTAFQLSTDTVSFTNPSDRIETNETTHPDALGYNKVDTIVLAVKWLEKTALDEGNITIYNATNDSILAVVPLLGADDYLVKDNASNSGIYTGIPADYTYHGSQYADYEYHQVNLTSAFAEDGTAIFDYLFIYGETTPATGTNITVPATGGTLVGSNAVTPYYIYKKAANADGKYIGYQFVQRVENANTSDKAIVDGIIVKDTATVYIDVQDSLRVYLTGFCPYATTGYTKEQEGVWLFRGTHGSKLDIYLEDCHIFSRNKTQNGNAFYGNKDGGKTFSEGFARGSGGVLVFENTSSTDQLHEVEPFEVNIHTIGNNLLKSNYGCFFILLESMKAYQISAPIHVHMASTAHIRTSKTTLNFDDLWPTTVDANNAITNTKRTNGYLGLKKQSNNAPSIDLGNPNTEVNFRGGQIELQNAQIVSPNYKTTLAISYRSGEYGGDETGIKLSYGIGTDSVGGTVNFYDGTTTVEPMKVAQEYRQYYLMDTLADGTESEYTSCLRTPKNTYVYGGSLCRVRACQHVTSKGGAPKDGPNGKFLGQYVYTLNEGDVQDPATELMTSISFPDNITGLRDYQHSRGYTYGLNSVTPDSNNQLYFWIPDGYGNVSAEVDKFLSTWKACMTEIRAGLGGIVEGAVGGDTPIEPNEEVKYLLYCKIDQNIHDVISAGEGEGDGKKYSYKAPVEVPSVASSYFDGAEYTKIAPTYISDSVEYQVLSDTTYTVTDKVYYVTTATADVWQTFTAPFDVEKIWVVEPFSEVELEKKGTRNQILLEQARHNADFAAFFAVAMAIGTSDSFEEIFDSYIKWAKIQDDSLGLYSGGEYALRGKYELIPYDGTNWATAQFYLNLNKDNWQLTTDEDGNEVFDVKWEIPTVGDDGILLHKDSTYSLLFPYCTGCWDYDEEGNFIERTMWDYWSGKFLIFESTSAPQTINGRDFLNDTIPGNIFSNKPNSGEVIMTGNSTFSFMNVADENIYIYSPVQNDELFLRNSESEELTILPTTAFLYGEVPTNAQNMPARSISRTGEINYGKGNTPSGVQNGNIPTINGGSDIFVTTIANGINIAVAAPQLVRVLSSSGALLFNGWVETSVDVTIPGNGIFVVSGENTSLKVLH